MIPDVGAEWIFTDRLAWEAGEIGDELHPEPDFDEDGLPIMFEENGRRYWCDAEGNITMNRTDAIDFLKGDGWNFYGAEAIVDTAIKDGILLTEAKLKELSEDYKDR
jgi:hypothetical protein